MSRVKVDYDGGYPTKCFGQWCIFVDGLPIPLENHGEFNTRGSYESWSFTGDWDVEWSSYYDGEGFNEWKEDIPNGLLKGLLQVLGEVDDVLLKELYEEIQEHDWRHNSCGGCI